MNDSLWYSNISEMCFAFFPMPAADCGDPGTPTNGQRSLSSTTYNSVVTYTCDVGYTLQGANSRTCQLDGWTGSLPQCQRTFKGCNISIHSKANWHLLLPSLFSFYSLL